MVAIVTTSIARESRDRYLTYALSVVSGRALPDVRDGLKPVQRRILYAMFHQLGLRPDVPHRKSAAVVGEVLARFHPHGDSACYEAMVRMAQDFSLRYPLVDGQGNFGSLDGDNAAAYRYTEVKLTPIAMAVMGEIGQDTVPFRDNFDVTVKEPVVLPSQVPNLLVNGASGIAVGMATNIPPHNLREVIKALIELSLDPDASESKLVTLVKGPDFPTGCLVLNTKKELDDMYSTGKGAIRMRGEWCLEEGAKGKASIIIQAIPYAVNKSTLVEQIANLIIERKLPQLVDVRDESTGIVRVVLELAPGADPDLAIAYLCKHSSFESQFSMNITALVPTATGALIPELCSLKRCLSQFLVFREEVTRRRLTYERKKLEERIHILEGLEKIFDDLDEALRIVRKSDGRSDAAKKLMDRFGLTEIQAHAVVDMRIYQLSRTSIEDVRKESADKRSQIAKISAILSKPERLAELVRAELAETAEKFGDKRRSKLVRDVEEVTLNEEDYLVREDVYAIITRDGWIKRVRRVNELSSTRVRDGDAIRAAHAVTTLDTVLVFTNFGNLYAIKVREFPASGGFGDPIQKVRKFRDGESIIGSFVIVVPTEGGEKPREASVVEGDAFFIVSAAGQGAIVSCADWEGIKKSGRRIAKVREGDEFVAVIRSSDEVMLFSAQGVAHRVALSEFPRRDGASLGVIALELKKGDVVRGATSGRATALVTLGSGKERSIEWREVPKGRRGLKGTKLKGLSAIEAVRESDS